MGFGFSKGAISKAKARQCDRQGQGYTCARCGCRILPVEPYILLLENMDFFVMPRVPIPQGGKSADNCVIVCPKCFKALDQDGTKVIPYSELPYFVVRPIPPPR